jgi:CHASE3 domain sensor protein
MDAPTARDAERASIEILNARRTERNYFLLHDPQDLEANRQAIDHLEEIIRACRNREPEEKGTLARMEAALQLYRRGMGEAVTRIGTSRQAPVDRIRDVVRAYELDLDNLLKRAPRTSRAHLIEELRNQVDSFDAQIASTAAAEDPAIRQITHELRTSSDEILTLATELGSRSWERVENDHHEARELVNRAEWVLIVVSALTLLVSVWVSFVLPRQAVKPLMDLKEAVDHAAAGNYEIEFNVQGEGEVVHLANSLRKLIAHIREKMEAEAPTRR